LTGPGRWWPEGVRTARRPGPARWLTAALLLVLPGSAPAAVRQVTLCTDTVPGGAPGELRHAILSAGPGDLVLVPACRITLLGDRFDSQSGSLDLTQAITIQGAGPGRTILDGNANDSAMTISSGTPVAIRGLTIENARNPNSGGGILIVGSGQVTLTDVVITRSTAGAAGGAISNQGGPLRLERVTLSDNAAVFGGGGLSSSGPETTLVNVTVSGNRSEFPGAGLSFAGPDPSLVSLINVTIVANDADSASSGDVFKRGGLAVGSDVTLTMRNSLLAGNTRSGGTPASDCVVSGTLVSLGSNLVQRPEGCTGLLASDLTEVDPLLAALALTGGPTPTHALRPGSPARDAGDGGCAPFDQRGVARPQGGRCDIGAFEAGAGTAGAFPDFDGDGVADIVVVAAAGGPGEVRVLGGADGSLIRAVAPFGLGFTAGLAVAACDLSGDGIPDLVVGVLGPDGPEVRSVDGLSGSPLPPPLGSIAPFGPGAGREGSPASLPVACADVDGDGTPDVIVGSPSGGADRLRILSGRDATLLGERVLSDLPGRGGLSLGP
jgi:hypothetical protein